MCDCALHEQLINGAVCVYVFCVSLESCCQQIHCAVIFLSLVVRHLGHPIYLGTPRARTSWVSEVFPGTLPLDSSQHHGQLQIQILIRTGKFSNVTLLLTKLMTLDPRPRNNYLFKLYMADLEQFI